MYMLKYFKFYNCNVGFKKKRSLGYVNTKPKPILKKFLVSLSQL